MPATPRGPGPTAPGERDLAVLRRSEDGARRMATNVRQRAGVRELWRLSSRAMKIRLLPAGKKAPRADLLFTFAFDRQVLVPPGLAAAVRAAKATGDLKTAFRKVSVFYPEERGVCARLGFVGLGPRKELDRERLRRAAALAQIRAEALEVPKFRIWLDADGHRGLSAEDAGRAIAEGLVLGAYVYTPPRKKKPEKRHAQSAEVDYAGAEAKAFAEGFRLGRIGAEATAFTRDLENLPGNLCTPRHLAEQARKLAGENVRVRVMGEAELRKLGMGALIGVAKGSKEPARLIVLDYRPPRAGRTLCVVGKGLTFDSGGISIKPSARMDEMRYDMCGAGAVLGLFHALRAGALRNGPRVRVVGVIAAAENMPGPEAQKPGDVVRAFDGTTIEVLNTDAEGRLVLADAIAWAKKTYAPEKMLDLATLTGAVVVALGHEATGIMGNDDRLVKEVVRAGERADEPLWQLPLWQVHRDQMKSRFADLRNINDPQQGGGSIAGGAFLAHFAAETPWAHLDIAGSAWGQRHRDYYRGGASGTAVRTLVQWLRAQE